MTDGDSGDATVGITAGGVTTTEILDATIAEDDLNVNNTPTDEQVLTWDATGPGHMEWTTTTDEGITLTTGFLAFPTSPDDGDYFLFNNISPLLTPLPNAYDAFESETYTRGYRGDIYVYQESNDRWLRQTTVQNVPDVQTLPVVASLAPTDFILAADQGDLSRVLVANFISIMFGNIGIHIQTPIDDTNWLPIMDPDGGLNGVNAAQRLLWPELRDGIIGSGSTPRPDGNTGDDLNENPVDNALHFMTEDATLLDTVDGAGDAYTAGKAGDVLKYDETNARWVKVFGVDPDTGDITGVTAGTGITVTDGDSGDATVGIAAGGVTTTEILDATIAEGDLNVNNPPSDGQALVWDDTNSYMKWATVAIDADTVLNEINVLPNGT